MRHQVEQIFRDLGKPARENQVDTVLKILDAFKSGKRHVFLNAPTGSGKSLIAMVLQKAMQTKTVVITATNALGEQYQKDFPHAPLIIGANNYPCTVRQKCGWPTATAESCYKKSKYFYTRFGEGKEPDDCNTDRCGFALTRALKHTAAISITNYSYYIIDQLYIKEVTQDKSNYHVGTAIFDEAHLINEMFSQHYAIYYSELRGKEFLRDIRKLIGDGTQMEAAYERVFRIIDENVARGSIGPVNHMKFVEMLERFYLKMLDIINTKKVFSPNEAAYDALGELEGKYHGLFCKIDDYKKFGYEVVVDVKKAEKSLSVVPIFVGKTSEKLLQQQNVFMSATLNYDFMLKTLDLDPTDCELITVPYTFNQDDKTLNFKYARRRLNFANMALPEVIEEMREDIQVISQQHKHENGVVITTSFKLAEQLAEQLKSTHRVMLHTKDVPAKQIIKEFKETTKPTILISPSLFEGVDLPGDISKFQVLVKAPFLSLGSKRMFHISRKHRSVYLQLTIMRMNQAFGRSTREKGDKSTTYLLDTNCSRLFNSKHNDCREQFHVIR